MKVFGYAGKILYVDLTSGETREELLDEKMIKDYIGGYGVNVKLAYELLPPDVDPLSPENLLIMGAGPLTGTLIPGATRFGITTRFPFNGVVATAYGGGKFALMLKSVGFDHVIISGKAQKPIYLKISESTVELRDATSLWGKGTFDTDDELRDIHEPCSIIPIGQAGENLVKMSVTLIDKITGIGSGGLPAIMGSKFLKAIVVEQGSKPVEVARPLQFMRLVNRLEDRIVSWPGRENMLASSYRPASDPINSLEFSYNYINNWTQIVPPESVDYPTMVRLHKEHRKIAACACCPIAEKEVIQLDDGKYYMSQLPEGNFWDSKNTEENYTHLVKYAHAANQYGICMHSFVNVVNLACYLYENGIISRGDVGGIELKDGYAFRMKLLDMIAHREGFGDVLADGALEAARRIGRGAQEYVHHCKGRTPLYEPRVRTLGTMEFEQVVSHRGMHSQSGGSPSFGPHRNIRDFETHLRRMGGDEAAVGRIIGENYVNLARFTRYSEDWFALFSCVGICNRAWINRFYSAQRIADLYTSVTGIERTVGEIMKVAERSWNTEKMLNVGLGYSRKDDKFPEAWFRPIKMGGREFPLTDYFGNIISRQDAERWLDDFYDERGWDKLTGVPSAAKLKELGIEAKA